MYIFDLSKTKNMKTLIALMEKQLAKAEKDYNKGVRLMNVTRRKHYKDWTDKDCLNFDTANTLVKKSDSIITALTPAIKHLKEIN